MVYLLSNIAVYWLFNAFLAIFELFFFSKQKTASGMRVSDWSSDVCSSDLAGTMRRGAEKPWWVERLARMVDNAWAMRLVSGQSLHAMLEVMAQRGRPGIRTMRQVLATRGLDYVPPASNLEARFRSDVGGAGQQGGWSGGARGVPDKS